MQKQTLLTSVFKMVKKQTQLQYVKPKTEQSSKEIVILSKNDPQKSIERTEANNQNNSKPYLLGRKRKKLTVKNKRNIETEESVNKTNYHLDVNSKFDGNKIQEITSN